MIGAAIARRYAAHPTDVMAAVRAPLLWSAVFYVAYRLLLVVRLYEGRELPPTNDSLNYVYRIAQVMEGVLMNDTSITYTYSLAFLGRLFGLDAFQAFELGYYLSPFLSLGILLFFFRRLGFSNGVAATCLFLLSFYAFGSHSFVHFVPSTLCVMLMILWFAVVSRGVSGRPWLYYTGLGVLNLAIAFSHSAGSYVLVANLLVLFAIHFVISRQKHIVPVTVVTLSVLAVFFLVTTTVTFETFGGGQHSWGRVASEFSGEFEMDEADKADEEEGALIVTAEEWARRVYDAFFFYIFPNVPVGTLNISFLALLALHSVTIKSPLLRRPFVILPFLAYFSAFLFFPLFYQRGVRLVEFVLPFCFMLVGISMWELGLRSKWLLRVPAVIVVSAVLAFVSYNVNITQNVKFKPLGHLPEAVHQRLTQGFTVYRGALAASYLLSQEIYDIKSIKDFAVLRFVEGDHALFELRPCMESPDSRSYEIFRQYFGRTPKIRMEPGGPPDREAPDEGTSRDGKKPGEAASSDRIDPEELAWFREIHRGRCYLVKDIVWK